MKGLINMKIKMLVDSEYFQCMCGICSNKKCPSFNSIEVNGEPKEVFVCRGFERNKREFGVFPCDNYRSYFHMQNAKWSDKPNIEED